ncbi:conserved hypothetical protein, partial [Ixodes scapularis]
DMSAYGPQVPPGKLSGRDRSQRRDELIGPVLPPGFKPSAPRDAGSGTDESSASSNEDAPDLYGPSLPPGFGKPDIIGPVLPPGFASSSSSSSSQSFIGPAMPPGFGKTPQADQEVPGDDDDSSDSYIGPKPSEAVGEDYAGNEAALDIDRRANKMKRHLEGKVCRLFTAYPSSILRTSCPSHYVIPLVEPVQVKLDLGLFLAQRSLQASQLMSSSFAAEKGQEGRGGAFASLEAQQERRGDCRTHRFLNPLQKEKRAESLLDMHRKKRKVEQSKVVVQERREFNREEDLKISHIDAKANKALLNKAALLNTKFAAGAQKFL